MDGRRGTRPDVDATCLSRGFCDRGEQRLDDIVYVDEIAHDLPIFVDFQRALLARPSCEKSDYSGVRIRQRLARSVDILSRSTLRWVSCAAVQAANMCSCVSLVAA